MGIGVVGLSTNQKKEGAGAPFPAGSADNGLSVDSGTGKIVLGNAVLSNDAQLLDDRIIPMDGNVIRFEEVPFSVFVRIGGQDIEIQTGTSNVMLTESGLTVIRSDASQASLSIGDPVDIMTLSINGTGLFVWNSANNGQIAGIDPDSGKWQIGFNPAAAFNGARLEVVGSLTSDLFVDSTGGVIAIDDINDKGKVFTNQSGASTFSLPGASTAAVGSHYTFVVCTAANLVIQATESDTITIDNVVSGAAGSATANTVGYCVHLVYVGNNQWIATSYTGTWAVV